MADESTQETSTQAGTVDLDSPAVKAAIQAAVQAAVQKAAAQADDSAKGLKKTNAELKEEKRKLQEELDVARTRSEAAEHGVDPTKLEELANAKAQRLVELKRREMASELQSLAEASEASKAEVAKLKAALHRKSVEALVPWDGIVQSPAARQLLVNRLEGLVTFQESEGGEVPILMKDGAVVAGTIPDLLSSARQGKGLLSDLGFVFASNGKGSGTTSTSGAAVGEKNVFKMTDAERAAYTKEHGLAKFTEKLANDPAPVIETAHSRR